MTDNDKKEFAVIMRVTWQSYHRNTPDKETMRYWFEKLNNHSLTIVGNAFDKWIISNDKELPTFKNIADLCKPNPTIFARLPSPLALAENHRHAVEVKDAVEKMTSNPKDMKGWAYKILATPKNYPDISIKLAKEALSYD
jgi:hypothetical protein